MLLLRSRTHRDSRCSAALTIGTGLVFSAFIGLVAVRTPWAGTWLYGLPIGGAAIAIALGTSDLSLSPTADRVISVVEYAAGAAVIPLACATAGFFTVIRSLV
jgi:NO-binding membrane sensor protein with MHYT domain